jgi:hypothetical protein
VEFGHFKVTASLGAVVRAPITSILIVFEHEFLQRIERDKIELERHMPRRSLVSLPSRPISMLANFSPIFARTTDRDELQ